MISVGDAVFHFLADTQDLDAAFNRVATDAGAKLAPAEKAIQGIGTAASDAGKQMAVSAQGAKEMGDVMQLSGEKAKFSMYEARGEVQLLGEEVGIHLPRHVASFVAELPGVGTALSAAFSATAVLFLIQSLIEGADKLSNWIADTFIFTAAMKQMDQVTKDFNSEVIRHNAEMAKLKVVYDELGMTATQKTKYEIDVLTKSIDQQTLALINLRNKEVEVQNPDTLGFWDKMVYYAKAATDQYLGTGFAMQQVSDEYVAAETKKQLAINKTDSGLREQNFELATKQKLLREQDEADFIRAQQARISAEKLGGEAVLAVRRAIALATVSFDGEMLTKESPNPAAI